MCVCVCVCVCVLHFFYELYSQVTLKTTCSDLITKFNPVHYFDGGTIH